MYDRYVSCHPRKDTRPGADSCNCNLCDFYFNYQSSEGADYQRKSHGPSFAPIQAQSRTIAPYQIAINGRESSEQ